MPEALTVLITEALHGDNDVLGQGIVVDARPELWSDRSGLLRAVSGCAGLVVRNQTIVDAELVAAAPRLRVVGRLGAGLDNLDLETLRRRHVVVVHGGGLNARAVAEHVLGAALCLARKMALSDREIRGGTWNRRPGIELQGRVFGVLGLGRTGRVAADLARAFGMKVIGTDPFASQPVPGIERVEFDELLRRSAVLSLHVPLTPQTKGLLGAAELARLSPGAILVNAARGGIVDEAALFEALRSGRLGGAALDVRANEPPDSDDPLCQLDNVLLTAHQAGLSTESQEAIVASVLGDVRRVLDGRSPKGPAIFPQ